MIKTDNLSLIYPERLVYENINLNIEKGEIVSLIGPAGSGKASILKTLVGLIKPTSGRAEVAGMDIIGIDFEKGNPERKIGYISDEISLFSAKTVLENLMFAQIHVLHRKKQDSYDKSMKLLKIGGLLDYAFCYPHELTSGQVRRVLICRELAMNPEVILFQSPTASLDVAQKSQTEFIIRRIADDFGCTVLLSSEDITFVRNISDKVIYIEGGHILASGKTSEIIDNPENEKIRNYISVYNKQEIVITSKSFDFVEMNTSIERFGISRMLSSVTVKRMISVFEELAVQMILPRMEDDFKLKMIMEYIEQEKSVRMQFEYSGVEFNPLADSDGISMAILKNNTDVAEYVGHNEIILDIRK